ncbi:Glycosyl transferase [Vigna unguiculata]|uniref:Glycosyl transferase n=1 Tax=Vigna unguiculata TaxID=3917 RepID=A0A4D6LNN5_VIGUN|nr:Glycosyl transferase [Vigna unguiculata]
MSVNSCIPDPTSSAGESQILFRISNFLIHTLLSVSDLAHVFSSVQRNLNFIDHTSDLGWKEKDRFQPIVVDPGIYLARRSQIFQATQKRDTPDAFNLFTGKFSFIQCSPWVILSRSFLEFCIFGWDNLPRTLLMYFTNVKLSQEGYFHSVICNAPEFKNTTVNADLRYMIWDNPPKMDPLFLNVSVYDQMAESGAAFARQFEAGDPVLDMIDRKILKRGRNHAVPGAWCSGRRSWWLDPCSQWGEDVNILKPGPQAKKLEGSVSNLLDDWSSHTNQCLTASEETQD